MCTDCDFIDGEDFDDDDYPEYVCECGFVDYWCELCGYHGHECELELEQEN